MLLIVESKTIPVASITKFINFTVLMSFSLISSGTRWLSYFLLIAVVFTRFQPPGIFPSIETILFVIFSMTTVSGLLYCTKESVWNSKSLFNLQTRFYFTFSNFLLLTHSFNSASNPYITRNPLQVTHIMTSDLA